jgi:ATP-binding cassette subfamily B protein
MMSGIFEIIQNSLTLLGYIALLVRWSPLLVGVLLISVLPATLAELKFSEEGFKLWSWRAPDSRKLGYLEYILANEGFAKELRMMGLQNLLLSRFSELAQRLRLQDKTLAMQRTFWAGGLSLLGTFAFYGCYAGLAWDAATRRITLGDLTLYVVAFRQGQQAFQSVLGALGGMYENNLYMSNLFAFLDRPAPEPKLQLQTPLKAMDGIRFVDVSFQYPGQSKKALDTINLHIPSGQSLALVGHNGSGKTTFIKLLTGLYTPTEGQILLDGRALAAWDPGQLRQRMAVIFQDFNRYQAPLFENVGFGNPARLEERALQEQALKKSGGEKFLIEHGLEKQLGRWFDKQGMELSGGQWQMVALARALVREEADVLILDEPTAALDAMAEAEVFTQVQGMAQGKTSILISHRFPTVRGADQIVVLEGGKIVEQGRHTELLEQGGRYAQLFTLQAQGYQ